MADKITYRAPTGVDVPACGQILFEAFRNISEAHGFPPQFPDVQRAAGLAEGLIQSPAIFGIVAELEGQVIGCNFMSEGDAIRGMGPITIDPAFQGRGVGRALMQIAMERARGAVSVRLLQDAFNTHSISLYASLGFDVKEPVVAMQGRPKSGPGGGIETRPMRSEDVPPCNELCRRVHGHDRASELQPGPRPADRWVASRGGRIVAYATGLNFWASNHAVAESDEDLQALMLGYAAARPDPLWFLLPSRQGNLFRWCLREGLRVTKPLNLMAVGEYPQIRGAWLPSILY
jgi:predicted N-acetyltransferase YhbS